MKNKLATLFGATSLVVAIFAIAAIIGAFVGQVWVIVTTIYRLAQATGGYPHIFFHGLLWFALWCVIQMIASIVVAIATAGA